MVRLARASGSTSGFGVRLIRRGEEACDVWDIIRINIRSADLVEMDIRSLVLGGGVAERRLVELITEMGIDQFQSASQTLIASTRAVLRERISEIEDGEYISIARVEYQNSLLRITCRMSVRGNQLIFDLTDAPPQVPHFFNSKLYILRGVIAPQLRELLAPGLSINQAFYDVIDIVTRPGTLVDSVMPAPIAARMGSLTTYASRAPAFVAALIICVVLGAVSLFMPPFIDWGAAFSQEDRQVSPRQVALYVSGILRLLRIAWCGLVMWGYTCCLQIGSINCYPAMEMVAPRARSSSP